MNTRLPVPFFPDVDIPKCEPDVETHHYSLFATDNTTHARLTARRIDGGDGVRAG